MFRKAIAVKKIIAFCLVFALCISCSTFTASFAESSATKDAKDSYEYYIQNRSDDSEVYNFNRVKEYADQYSAWYPDSATDFICKCMLDKSKSFLSANTEAKIDRQNHYSDAGNEIWIWVKWENNDGKITIYENESFTDISFVFPYDKPLKDRFHSYIFIADAVALYAKLIGKHINWYSLDMSGRSSVGENTTYVFIYTDDESFAKYIGTHDEYGYNYKRKISEVDLIGFVYFEKINY